MDDKRIVFQDDHLLVVNKPAGLPVSGGRGKSSANSGETLVGQVQAVWGANLINAHRIDADLSGLVVFARTKTALDFVSGEFQSKMAERVHQGFAVVATEAEHQARYADFPLLRTAGGGLPATFAVNFGLGPDQNDPGRVHVYRKRGGRPAGTRVRVLETFGGGRFVWFEAVPETSREMQVQAHLAAVGAPVLGDAMHGLPDVALRLSQFKRGYKGRDTERPMIEGLALHLGRVTLRHPASREPITVTAPLPTAFEVALRNLRRFATR